MSDDICDAVFVRMFINVVISRVDLQQDALVRRFVRGFRDICFEVIGLLVSSNGLALVLDALVAALSWVIRRHFISLMLAVHES